MRKFGLIAVLASALAMSFGGCPPKENNNGNSSSSQNENASGETNENSGSSQNENANGGTSTNQNANTAVNQNENSPAGNENANTSANANDNSSGNTNTNGRSELPITGNYTGSLSGTSVLTVINLAQPSTRNRSFASTIAFDSAFIPASIPIALYDSVSSQSTTLIAESLTNVAAGQSQTFNYNHPSDGAVTLTANVQTANYSLDSAHVVIALQISSVSGNLVESGTGTQTFDATVDSSGNISVSIQSSYAVRLTAGSLNFDTTDVIQYSATLPKQ